MARPSFRRWTRWFFLNSLNRWLSWVVAIGMEFAYFYNAMGTKVTVIEMMDQIFPNEDEAVSSASCSRPSRNGESTSMSAR